MGLSEKERQQLEIEARVDAADGVTRHHKGDAVIDVVFAPLDLMLGDKNTSERAAEKQEYYEDVKSAIERRP